VERWPDAETRHGYRRHGEREPEIRIYPRFNMNLGCFNAKQLLDTRD
jgi:hypothetical protein